MVSHALLCWIESIMFAFIYSYCLLHNKDCKYENNITTWVVPNFFKIFVVPHHLVELDTEPTVELVHSKMITNQKTSKLLAATNSSIAIRIIWRKEYTF